VRGDDETGKGQKHERDMLKDIRNRLIRIIRRAVGFYILQAKLEEYITGYGNISQCGYTNDELSLDVIQQKMSLPLTDEQMLGAYRVMNYRTANPQTAQALIARHRFEQRPAEWVFYAILDIPDTYLTLNMQKIKQYSLPMPVELTAGDDVDFKATIYGWAYDFYVTKIISDTGRYEPIIQDTFKKYISYGDVVFDIGANIGCHTALFAHLVGKCGEVYAFEPIESNYKNLQYMIEKNKYNNIKIYNYAASSDNKQACILISQTNIGGHSIPATPPPQLGGSNTRENEISSAYIICKRLDDEFMNIKRLDFIKIDVEGHESHAFEGMKYIIEKFMPYILMEFAPQSMISRGGDPQKMLDWLFKLYGKAFIPEHNNKKFLSIYDIIEYANTFGYVNILFTKIFKSQYI
jgi:FkbM family methyltransferase